MFIARLFSLHVCLPFLLVIMTSLASCSGNEKTLFTALTASATGLDFENTLAETPENNIMTYQYLYNGAGIAAGDLDGDGLADLYVCGNASPNKLYLNKGNWKFEDVTAASGALDRAGDWKTGVTMADVNGDGWLDIYVCYSGNTTGEGFNLPVVKNNRHRANQLFINQGGKPGEPPTFVESAAAYGLDALGTFSTQAYFFDYDRDGDLDMFLLNHANTFYATFFNTTRLRTMRHPYFGNKLYRNDNLHFVEVSDTAGIYGGGLNFSLGAAISDLNNDSWPDIYVTNDYDEQDYCYLNNGNGTFTDIAHEAMGHLSKNSMGVDIADVNNDLRPDIFVADMLPEDNERQKLLKGADQYDKYTLAVDSGFHHQNMRNTFQLNAGMGPGGIPLFREVGQQAGISNTDWSWGPLFADFDNDGWKDLFVTNGYLHDFTNMDFLKFIGSETVNKDPASYNMLELIRNMPSTRLTSYAYRNLGGWQFENTTASWGFTHKGVSNAVVYADFDNDGDLDLIANRLNDGLGIYKNQSELLGSNHFIKIKLQGTGRNQWGIGARVWVTTDSLTIYQEAFYNRGYESSVEPVLTLGLGRHTQVTAVTVQWADGRITTLRQVPAGTTVVAHQQQAVPGPPPQPAAVKNVLTDYTALSGLNFRHRENNFVDFKSQRLLPYQLSRLGGKMAVGDVNNDGNDDVFFCGASGQAGQLFLGKNNGTWEPNGSQPWQADLACEDLDALFFDADADSDQDLYVVSGGNEFSANDSLYHDRLYLNNGRGTFTRATGALPAAERSSGSCVVAADYDQDGDLDLFVGGRLTVSRYPLTPPSYLLRNDTHQGHVRFTDVTEETAQPLRLAGMVTAAAWIDLDKDGWQDLLIAGEWMPVKIFKNNQGKGFSDVSAQSGTGSYTGWWTSLVVGDFDSDGDIDLIAGNAGTNLQFKATEQEPLAYYNTDIDQDGTNDPILCYYINGKSYPSPSYDELVEQVPFLRKKFYKYADYAVAGIGEVLGNAAAVPPPYLTANTLQSSFFRNDGKGKFDILPLPANFQSSMLQAFVWDDVDHDGQAELLAGGNFYPYKVEWGKSDAFFGALLQFSPGGLREKSAGSLWLTGDIRDMKQVRFKSGKKAIVVSRNNDKAGIYAY